MQYRTANLAMTESNQDTVGQFKMVNPFTLERVNRTELLANGRNYTSGNSWTEWKTWPVATRPDISHAAFPVPPADVANILAISTPSRPVVDLPVAVFELKDLPGMIRFAGTTLLQLKRRNQSYFLNKEFGAEANLQWQFGWAPLLGDLAKLLEFHSHVAKRRKELETLYSKGVLRRRVKLGSGETAVIRNPTSGATVISSAPRVDGYTTTRTTYEAWATVKWHPDVSLIPEPSHIEVQAFRSALGLDLTMSTIWESLPWSWLIDWCSNIGDFLMSHRGTVPAHPGDISVMRRTVTTSSVIRTTNPPAGVAFSGIASVSRTSLTRRLAVPVPILNVSLPFLGARRLSILGSLAVLNKGGWRARGTMR